MIRVGTARISRQTYEIAALAAMTALTRFLFRSHRLYDIDSVNFALALRRFDPATHQPHPPGYFLYVYSARFASLLFHDANTALVALSIFFSCGAVALIYALGRDWFGRNAGRFAGLIFVFSPLAWFHGVVALTYIVEAFFSALVGLLCWKVNRGAFGFVLPAAIALGLSAGFRPSSLLFLGPLFLFSLRRAPARQISVGIGALAVTILAWFLPMIHLIGAGSYFSSLASLWLAVPSKVSVVNSPVANSIVRALLIAGIYFLCFGAVAILPVWAPRPQPRPARNHATFAAFWIVPSLLFFVFVYLKFVNSGYLLIVMPPVCAWLGSRADNWYRSSPVPLSLKFLAIAACAAVNTAIFLWAPVYCSYGEITRFESELAAVIEVLPQVAPAGQTVIVGLDSHFLGYRHAGYYLPEYLTLQYPEVRLDAGMRVFAMQQGDTSLKSSLAALPLRNFVIFPLPPGDAEYVEYVARLLERFPPGDLHSVSRGGNNYITGPVADLRFLFPALTESESERRPQPLTDPREPEVSRVANR